ncbi:uncharacterized protein EI90DRAFT_3118247 [Cantharellus anzutake]|uniref:uncharacterized protein n=1 Tax=Cantharellus anzutake TaxID=1750568 RepID=UPI001904C71E|nr:uncharacterized protein EI90DRAFT_3118247 [Cantharellus anzutake]KAF8339164.1 hypothetical protein EI90DRAFT_3118247 [Cantharellus anzutake]
MTEDLEDRLKISIPENNPGVSAKKSWVKEHKDSWRKNSRDESHIYLYTDRSLLLNQGICRAGYGFAAFHHGTDIFKGKGGLGARVEVYDAEMEGLAQGTAHLTAWIDKNIPTHNKLTLSTFLSRLTNPGAPSAAINADRRFRRPKPILTSPNPMSVLSTMHRFRTFRNLCPFLVVLDTSGQVNTPLRILLAIMLSFCDSTDRPPSVVDSSAPC